MKRFMLFSVLMSLVSTASFAQVPNPFKNCNDAIAKHFGDKVQFGPDAKIQKHGILGETYVYRPGPPPKILNHVMYQVVDRGGDIADYLDVFYGPDGKTPTGIQYSVKLPGYMAKNYDHFNGEALKFAYDADGNCRIDEISTFTYDNDIQKFENHKVASSEECKMVDELYRKYPYLEQCSRISITDMAMFQNTMDDLEGHETKLKLSLDNVKLSPKPNSEDAYQDESESVRHALTLQCIDPVLSAEAVKKLKLSGHNLDQNNWDSSEKLASDLNYLPLKKVNALKHRCDAYSELKANSGPAQAAGTTSAPGGDPLPNVKPAVWGN